VHRNNILSLPPTVPARLVWAALGKTVELPCDLTPPTSQDSVKLLLWFKDTTGIPLYRWAKLLPYAFWLSPGSLVRNHPLEESARQPSIHPSIRQECEIIVNIPFLTPNVFYFFLPSRALLAYFRQLPHICAYNVHVRMFFFCWRQGCARHNPLCYNKCKAHPITAVVAKV